MLEVSIHYPTARKVDEPYVERARIEFVLPKRPFLFWASYYESECLQFPRGYGVVYYSPNCNRVLFAPMPFNILIAVAIHIYHWLRTGFAIWLYRHNPLKKRAVR